MIIGRYQLLLWPTFLGFGRWHYPQHWARDDAIFTGYLLGFLELRVFNKAIKDKIGQGVP